MTNKYPFFDVTILHYGADRRGIPQVVMQLVRMFVESETFKDILFIATIKSLDILRSLGVPSSRIFVVPVIPFLPDNMLFHGLFSWWRYRKIRKVASLIIHSDFKTVIHSDLPQVVIYYDLFLLEHFRTRSRGPLSLKVIPYLLIYNFLLRKFVLSLRCRYKISISEFTKKEIITAFPHSTAEEITALPIGTRFIGPCAKKKNSLSSPILFLYVGGILDPRKNITSMIDNFDSIVCGKPFHLDLVGVISPPKSLSILNHAIRKNGIDTFTTIHGVISERDLENLYNHADILLFPSLKEGFGLPVIEAMSHGLVVCAFNNSSLPEICGDAAILAENGDYGSWGKKIEQLSHMPSEFQRLSEQSIVQSGKFNESEMFKRYSRYFQNIVPVPR